MRKRVSINLSEKVIMKIRTLHPFKLVEQWREIYFFLMEAGSRKNNLKQ
jgi:hypothetical protein